jgi:hypothetical protein
MNIPVGNVIEGPQTGTAGGRWRKKRSTKMNGRQNDMRFPHNGFKIIYQFLIFVNEVCSQWKKTEKLGTQNKGTVQVKYNDTTSTEVNLFASLIKHRVINTYRGVEVYLK